MAIKYDIPVIQSTVQTINGHADGISNEVIAKLPPQIDALNQAATAIQQSADAFDGHIRGIKAAEGNCIPASWEGASANAASAAITTWQSQASGLQQNLAGLNKPLSSLREELEGLKKSLDGQNAHIIQLKDSMNKAQQQAETTDQQLAGGFH